MNTNRTLVIAVIAATTLCAALVWSNVAAIGRARDLKVQLDAKEAELQQLAANKPNSPTVDTGLGDMLARREVEYAQLREEYERLKERIASNAVPSMVSTNASADRRGGGPGNNAWLERLRQQDPERYKQMIAARDERRKRADQQYQDQMNQLENRIQSAPTQEEVDLASQIADTIDHLGQLREKMQALRDLPDDQRQAAFEELGPQLREATQTLRDLRDQDRTLQLQQLGTALGLQDQKIQTLVDGVPEIYQKTQYQVPGGGGPGGPGGGFGGDGRRNGGTGASGTQSQTPQPPSTTR